MGLPGPLLPALACQKVPHRGLGSPCVQEQAGSSPVVCRPVALSSQALCPESVLSSVARPCPGMSTSGGCVCWDRVLHGWKPLAKRGGHGLRGVGRLLPGTWGWGLWRPLQAAAKMQLLGAWPVPVLGLTGRGLVSRGASSHMRPCRSSQRGAGDQAHGPLSRSWLCCRPLAAGPHAPSPLPRLGCRRLCARLSSRRGLAAGHSAAGASAGTGPLGLEWQS